MKIVCSNFDDYDAWISLAREVEPLFGPMADEESFQAALKTSILENRAFCVRGEVGKDDCLKGGIVISKELNEIACINVMGA